MFRNFMHPLFYSIQPAMPVIVATQNHHLTIEDKGGAILT